MPGAVVALLCSVAGVQAQVDAFIGTPVASVQLQSAGAPVTDPQVLELVETRVGQPLAMVHVRESIAHLATLDRYEDIAVEATAGERGVDLLYRLAPVRVIGSVHIRGEAGVSDRRLRRVVRDRVGPNPRATSLGDLVAAVREELRAQGYFQPSVLPTLGPADASGRSSLTLNVEAGPRARVGRVTVVGTLPQGTGGLLADLRLSHGRPWDAAEVEARAQRVVAKLRERGYYEASVDVSSRVDADQTSVDVTVAADAGPLVELVFQGDTLPGDRVKTLVPVEREGSVDEDLLEDSKRRIEEFLHGQGYWRAVVDYQRSETNDRLRVVFRIDRGRRYEVSNIEIDGALAFPRPEFDALLRTRVGMPFVQATLDADRAVIEQHYRARGFAGVRVMADVLPAGADSTWETGLVTPRIVVEEGVQTNVGTVTFRGRTTIPDAELRQAIKLAPGTPFYAPLLAADRNTILGVLQNRGFREASVRAEVTPSADRRTVDVVFILDQGPQVLVDHVIVVGNDRTGLDTIERELKMQPGDPVGAEALTSAQRRLSALGLFRRVRVEDRGLPGDPSRDVVVFVEEAPATTLGYGGGLEVSQRLERSDVPDEPAVERLEFAPRAFFEIGRRNLWGKNRSVNLFTRVSFRRGGQDAETSEDSALGFNEYRFVATWREPRVFGWTADGQVAAFAEQAIRASFSYRRRGVTADLTRRLTPTVTLLARYAFGNTEIFDERYNPSEQPLIDRLFPQVQLSVISGGLVRDTRDDPLDPERGTLLSFDLATALESIGSEVGYVKGLGEAFYFRRLTPARRIVFAGGARLGLATGFERFVRRVDESGQEVIEVVKDLPASERFYAGGDTTVRGFSQDRLGDTGTIDQDGFPTGGNAVIILNTELRLPVWRALGAAAFVDAGNVFLRASDVELSRLRATGGVGLRYRSPIGPVRVDIGFKFDRQVTSSGTRERPYVVHISLGQAF